VRADLAITSKIDQNIEELHKVIREVLLQLDPEAARLFLDRFTEKLNEQKCAQENSGTSR
jgi:hypothetical protein